MSKCLVAIREERPCFLRFSKTILQSRNYIPYNSAFDINFRSLQIQKIDAAAHTCQFLVAVHSFPK